MLSMSLQNNVKETEAHGWQDLALCVEGNRQNRYWKIIALFNFSDRKNGKVMLGRCGANLKAVARNALVFGC